MPAARLKPAPNKRKPRKRSDARHAPGVTEALLRLGERLRELRTQRHLSQEAAREQAGIDPKHLQLVEHGKSNATIATLLALSRTLGVRIDDLVRGIDEAPARSI